MDNRLRPEEGGRGGTCNEGVDHVCVTWIARVTGRDVGDAGTGVAMAWASGVSERGERFANCRAAERRQRDEAKVARLVYRAGRGMGREKGVQVAASIDGAKY